MLIQLLKGTAEKLKNHAPPIIDLTRASEPMYPDWLGPFYDGLVRTLPPKSRAREDAEAVVGAVADAVTDWVRDELKDAIVALWNWSREQ